MPHFFRKGSEAVRGRLQQGLHRAADAIDRGIDRSAQAMDRGVENGANALSAAGTRLRERMRPSAGGSEGLDPETPAGERNHPSGFPTNPPQAAARASESPPPPPCDTPPSQPFEPFEGPLPGPDTQPRKTMSIFRSIFRFGVIGGLLTAAAVGGTVLVAGPERSGALFDEVKTSVIHTIDLAIDDPAALRSQLKELESQYPERIAMLRGDLAELNQQIRELKRDEAISERVVSLAERDIAALEPQLAAAQRGEGAGGQRLVAATVQLENRVYTANQASARLNQIQQTRVAYSNRAADASHDLVYLENQAERLGEMLLQLETERAQFQAQIAQLERQVDAVARNERLIGMLEKRQRTLDECSRYEAESLDQIVARLGEVRSRQEATLEYLTGDQRRQDYESIARMQLETDVDVQMPDVETEGLAVIR